MPAPPTKASQTDDSPHVPRTREGDADLFSTAFTALGRSLKGPRRERPFKIRANGPLPGTRLPASSCG